MSASGPASQPLDYARGDNAPERHPPGFRLRRFRNWLFLGLLYAGYYLCRYNYSTVLPEMSAELGYNKQQTGWISTGRDFGYAIGQFVNGLFVDAIGGKQAMAIGAIGTVLLNLVFGSLYGVDAAFLLTSFVVVRSLDGYMQSFGAPGMVKINTSWFQRRERGKFAGIFGGVIQLGVVGVNQLSALILGGFAITWLGIELAKQNWRMMFFIPPLMATGILVLMWFNVRNHPEEAGYRIRHDDDLHGDTPQHRLPIRQVFLTIAGNPFAWIAGLAYFCTGFVRRASDLRWAQYMQETWQVDKTSSYFLILAYSLPIAGFLGSFLAGYLSDTYFRGKRSPVGALLYTVETVVIVAAWWVLGHSSYGGPLSATVFLTLISLTCNSSHSILGTAVAMDIGGRKMSGFSLGIVNSWQYWGAMLAGWYLGGYIDHFGWDALFLSMIPFSLFGAVLMAGVWLATRGRDVKGS